MYEAILASLLDHTKNEEQSMKNVFDAEEEQRILKEVMQLSKLEAERNKGHLDLSQIKRKNKPEKKEKQKVKKVRSSGSFDDGFGALDETKHR
jgi:hypothetical protein